MPRRQITLFDPRTMMADRWADSFFNSAFSDVVTTEIEMFEDDENVVVKVKAPGFTEDNVDIAVEDNVLTVSGTSKEEDEEADKKKKYYFREISTQSFTRSVSLPVRVKAENSSAEFKNGILTIMLPKAEEVKPKKISIKAQ
jgi:HSP20 family protein